MYSKFLTILCYVTAGTKRLRHTNILAHLVVKVSRKQGQWSEGFCAFLLIREQIKVKQFATNNDPK